ncbi:MAG TPA: sulfite exporter TauE/SafE family protein [Actinomycetota bacterium]|nr:sulfite exporter TauE/SafE family protein [Actinomycetota bacterium]
MPTLPELVLLFFVLAAGSAIQGSLGFGLNLIAAPVMALVDHRLVPGPALAAALLLTMLIARRERASIDLGGIGWALVGRVPGTVAGALAVAAFQPRQLAIALAAAVVVGVVTSVGGWHVRPTAPVLVGAGALSGLMGTASSIGGPPMAMVYQREPGATMRGTLSGFFVIGAAMSIALLAAVGKFGLQELRLSGVLLPGILAGFAVSSRTSKLLDKGLTRPAVLVLSLLSAVALVIRELW